MKDKNFYSPSNLFSLKDEVVLVTGAAGQLGSQIVLGLIECGAKVIALDLDLELLQEKKLNLDWNEDVFLVKADITKRNQVKQAYSKGINQFGKVTSLVANAGVSVFEDFLERKEESIDFVMDVNLKGSIFCVQEFLKNLKQNNLGSIVFTGSFYGIISPDPRIYNEGDRKNSEIYGASKAGIIQMAKYYAVHASEYGIRSNSISPGGIRNPENPQSKKFQENYSHRCPMGRMAETEEIIGAVIFLLSKAASYINGQNIVIDGGSSSW